MSILLISFLIIVIIAALSHKRTDTTDPYDASFMNETEIASRFNKGFCINGRRSLTIEDSIKHLLITGGTGAYKTSGILIPSILKMAGHVSFVINDPSGELLELTSGPLQKKGTKVKVLNYNAPSEGFNPLARVNLDSLSSIKKISKLIITTALGSGGRDPFWNASAENLCSLCIQAVLELMPKEYHTLSNVYFLASIIGAEPERADRFFIKGSTSLLMEYKAVIAYPQNTILSIIATLRTALSIFGTDNNVSLVTSHDTIDFEEFRYSKVALFINNSVTTMKYHAVTTSLFLDQFFEHIMSSRPDPKKIYPTFICIDEASSLVFNNLQITISNIRKHYAGILQAYQSVSQLIDLYTSPVARAIIENSFTRIYMAGQPLNVALELEALIGKTEYVDERNNRHIGPLLPANKIHELSDSLIFCGNHRAIKTPITPFFKRGNLRRLTQLPPYQPINKIPFKKPPLFPFDLNEKSYA